MPPAYASFFLLLPGNYRVSFAAAGFRMAEVLLVTVNVTETPLLNQTLSFRSIPSVD